MEIEIRPYESEGFAVVRTFASENEGYPCTCVRLPRSGRAPASG